MILLIDNYDSFVHNLARYFERLGQETVVLRNDAIDAHAVRRLAPQAIVLSPGPCTPAEAGNSLDIARQLHTEVPMLGVCLGHQTIAAALGGKIIRARRPMHGRTSRLQHTGQRLFVGLPSPMTVCRYHSLVVDPRSVPETLEISAWTEDEAMMAFAHRKLSVFGVQFHPEAILTELGYPLLANFLHLAGCETASEVEKLAAMENRSPRPTEVEPPHQAVTF